MSKSMDIGTIPECLAAVLILGGAALWFVMWRRRK